MIHKWPLRHPRFHLYFTPTSASWLNQVERWFAEITNKHTRRVSYRSTRGTRAGHRGLSDRLQRRPQALPLDEVGGRHPRIPEELLRKQLLMQDTMSCFPLLSYSDPAPPCLRSCFSEPTPAVPACPCTKDSANDDPRSMSVAAMELTPEPRTPHGCGGGSPRRTGCTQTRWGSGRGASSRGGRRYSPRQRPSPNCERRIHGLHRTPLRWPRPEVMADSTPRACDPYVVRLVVRDRATLGGDFDVKRRRVR